MYKNCIYYLHVYTCLIRQILGKNMFHKTNDVQVHYPTSITFLFSYDNLGIINGWYFNSNLTNVSNSDYNVHVQCTCTNTNNCFSAVYNCCLLVLVVVYILPAGLVCSSSARYFTQHTHYLTKPPEMTQLP